MSNEGLAREWDASLYDSQHAFVWRHGASLVELLAPRPGERVLDLGCGTGHLAAQIAAAGAEVVGLDSDPAMLAKARAAYPHLTFVQADARDFTVPAPVDAVFSNAVLHWVRPPATVVRCVWQALRPGGRFVAEFGGRGNVRHLMAAIETAIRDCGLTAKLPDWYFPSIGEYAGLLEANDFEVAGAWLFDRPTPLTGESGLRDWVAMFCPDAAGAVPLDRREPFFRRLEDAARPALFRDGGWLADYRRLRVVAHHKV